ncbi:MULTISPECIES: AraC family transcriptional regulator [Sphingobacterium]|uniref:AraC family transcriptional regulator n=1 Tax=Sphingobacterium kitahiroshimense TaxID=470446 RepID=A0ABV0C0H0_9SPHI|nr:AraC family transcriptional regulator [Sphingobacterium sp. B16(2022)]NJI72455.1 AraC family transcriptional regulator [Sphingobacterium sp. B16(2022)]
MNTIKFHKSDCGVEVLLNVLIGEDVKESYLNTDTFNTDFFEIVIFKKVKGTLILNQQKIKLTDNSIVFISPFQKRKWKLAPDDLDFTVLVFQENFLNDFFSDKLFTYRLLYFYQLNFPLDILVEREEIAKICAMLSEIKLELVSPQPDSSHIIRSLTYYLLQKFNRVYAIQNKLSLDNTEHNFAYQYKLLLELHIRHHQRIEDYVKLLGVSRITLNAVVKKLFHVTATHLLKQRLLFEIKNDLIHSGKTITEIAYELNFSEPNHLMRFFKAQTGMTAGQFYANYQNGIFS